MLEKKLTINHIIIIAVGSAVGAIVPIVLQNTVYSPSAKIDRSLMKAASQINENCPIMIDKETRLDNAFGGDNKITYNYTLVNVLKDEINLKIFATDIRPIVIQNFKNIPESHEMFRQGVTLICRYKDKNGFFLTDISITKNDLGL